LARGLGIHAHTLGSWLDDASGDCAFVPVVLEDDHLARRVCGPEAPGGTGQGLIAVVAPSGFRLEGLDLDSAVAVLRRLA